MNFSESIQACFSKFASARGRASKSEFWWFFLFTILMDWAAKIAGDDGVALLVNLVLMIPSTAVGTRRLHDVDRSGWWQLLCITVIGIIPVAYWLAQDGNKNKNEYGDPAPIS